MDSVYKVPYTKILAIHPHTNADRLALYTVYGFQVIGGKDQYKVGDRVVYVPVDSVFNDWELEGRLFPIDGKVKLNGHRVRQIRLRGLASQGLLIDPKDLKDIVNFKYVKDEQDLSEVLKITKYEPEVKGPAQTVGTRKLRNKPQDNPLLHKYHGLSNLKWFPNLFEEGEQVVVTEKLHGSNCRAGKLPYNSNTLWKKFKRLFNLNPKWENCYGSNNVEISNSPKYKGWYGEDVYGKTLERTSLWDDLPEGYVAYGEVIGPGIQKNYNYGLEETKFVLFDVKRMTLDGKMEWLNPDQVKNFANKYDLEMVPTLYEGPYNRAFLDTLNTGPSVYCPEQKVREGIVIKAATDYNVNGNKKALKLINEDYLADSSNSDNH